MVQLSWIDVNRLISLLQEKGVYVRRQNHKYLMLIFVKGCFSADVHLECADGNTMFSTVKFNDYARIDLSNEGIAIRGVNKVGNRFYETGEFAGLYFKGNPEFVSIGPNLQVRVSLQNHSWIDIKSCVWWL